MLHKNSPHKGKRLLRSKWPRRSTAVAGAVICLLIAICGGTYAYFTAKDQVVNELDISNLDFEIEEPSWEDPDTPVRPGDVLPKDPQIVNTGETAFVVRVKIQEVWTPKDPTSELPTLTNPDYVRYFAADSQIPAAGTNFSAQQLLDILRNDSQLEEGKKNFALRLNLLPNQTNSNAFTNEITDMWTQSSGWYRGKNADGTPSEWLYYNQIVEVTGRTEPVFRAVTIRTEEELEAAAELPTGIIFEPPEYEKYNLDIYIYAETVQADAFAWQDAWGSELPDGWGTTWGGTTP
ncbi:hypothetical protein B5E56_10420 [Flavonifractor sp. An112]|uniref:BsaA family SipW-dependent biofilm matrix protein n=1 Tax=Flavonifractor sp. An112 TaxID=1965544 RepID=UPI000B39EA63|nr:BsaA family SipW-dependent biofilm matrix protein [Flavonifractor sp. An112]OUQ58674.1 hypothetical protein B5E56_10420 [Flavonifractor sp. An112]